MPRCRRGERNRNGFDGEVDVGAVKAEEEDEDGREGYECKEGAQSGFKYS